MAEEILTATTQHVLSGVGLAFPENRGSWQGGTFGGRHSRYAQSTLSKVVRNKISTVNAPSKAVACRVEDEQIHHPMGYHTQKETPYAITDQCSCPTPAQFKITKVNKKSYAPCSSIPNCSGLLGVGVSSVPSRPSRFRINTSSWLTGRSPSFSTMASRRLLRRSRSVGSLLPRSRGVVARHDSHACTLLGRGRDALERGSIMAGVMRSSRALLSQSRSRASCARRRTSSLALRRSFRIKTRARGFAMKRSQTILVAALRISTLWHVASVCRDSSLMASSLPFADGIARGGCGLCTSVSWMMCRRPWATPLTAAKVKMPGEISAGNEGV